MSEDTEIHGRPLRARDLDDQIRRHPTCPCCDLPYSRFNPLALIPKCHPDGQIRARYWDGLLSLECATCEKLIIRLKLA